MRSATATATEEEQVRAWRPELPGVREVFQARFVEHRYPPHTHDTWTVLLVDQGAIRYDLDTREQGGWPGTVTVLPPHVVHDGRSAHRAGFRKRVLYLETTELDECLAGAAVDRPVLVDPSLHRALHQLHRRLAVGDDLLGGDAALADAVARLRAHLDPGSDAADPTVQADDPVLADRLRQLLDAHRFEPLTLQQAGVLLGASPTHLARSFTRAYGVPPHGYVIGRRIDAARRLLLDGQPPAQVAVATGFYDQAHLTRHFTRHVGTTPARFARLPSRPRR